jgi:hypothetical protein
LRRQVKQFRRATAGASSGGRRVFHISRRPFSFLKQPFIGDYYPVNVFVKFDPDQAAVLVLWKRSWEARGWTARLISQAKDDEPVTLRVPVNVINFSFRNPRETPRRIAWKVFGHPGWEKSPLVFFPNATEETILKCGRRI